MLGGVRRTEVCAARTRVGPRGARERLSGAQLSGLWRGGSADPCVAASLESASVLASACWRARSRSRWSRRACLTRSVRQVVWARRSAGSSVARMRSAKVSWSSSSAGALRCSAASCSMSARRAFFFSTRSSVGAPPWPRRRTPRSRRPRRPRGGASPRPSGPSSTCPGPGARRRPGERSGPPAPPAGRRPGSTASRRASEWRRARCATWSSRHTCCTPSSSS